MSGRNASAEQDEVPGCSPMVDSLAQQIGDLELQPSRDKSTIHQPLVPAFYPAPPTNFRSLSYESQPLVGPSNERSYLLENRRRQHNRGERLSRALSEVETRLASAQNKGEARRLRKEAGLLRNKVAESRKQEDLITLRLNDLQNEDLMRFYQVQQQCLFPYPSPPPQPWSLIPMPPMTPLTPIPALTPLPAGIYRPAPVPLSALGYPFSFSPTYSMLAPAVPFDQSLYFTGYNHGLPVPEPSDGGSRATLGEARRDSVLLAEPVRRWSLADAYSPSPRDKRMSVPELKTIWRF